MKKIGALLLSVAIALIGITSLVTTRVVAAEVTTVEGTVQTGTSSSFLKLNTDSGVMEIKIDANADWSECKNLLPGRKVQVDVYYGGDSYMHASRLKDIASTSNTKGITATGIIEDIQTSSSDIIYFKTASGNIAIKVNTSTNMDNCKVLVAGNYYTIIYTGTSYYKDALEIRDIGASTTTTTTTTTTNKLSGTSDITANTVSTNFDITNVNNATASVKGTVTADTTATVLYLNTSGGVMQFKIDSDTIFDDALVEVPGVTYKVFYGYGTDSYLHARVVKGDREAVQSGAALNGATATVKGTLCGNSSEGLIRLNTESGIMLLKTDKLETVTGGSRIITNQSVTANISYGTDAYWHVTSITIH